MGIGLEDDMGREEEVSCGGYMYFMGFIRIKLASHIIRFLPVSLLKNTYPFELTIADQII